MCQLQQKCVLALLKMQADFAKIWVTFGKKKKAPKATKDMPLKQKKKVNFSKYLLNLTKYVRT